MKSVRITDKDFRLYEIQNEFDDCWNPKPWNELSDFEAFFIRKIGDLIRGRESQHFWSNGQFSWYVDAKQEHIQRVWLTSNGILVFFDDTSGTIYRVMFE